MATDNDRDQETSRPGTGDTTAPLDSRTMGSDASQPGATTSSGDPTSDPTTAVRLPTLSPPKGGGAIRGVGEKLTPNPASGSLNLTIPIATSPGRSDVDLGLSLRYDSAAGNGPFGVGWQLSVPSITRKTDKGLPRYLDDEDVFIFVGAEDLVPLRISKHAKLDVHSSEGYVVQRYRPRVEAGFVRIERWEERHTGDVHWRATSGNNILSIFGLTAAARVADPDDPRRVFSWLLEQTQDDRGNVAQYTYKQEDGAGVDPGRANEAHRFLDVGQKQTVFQAGAQRYLKRIAYNNRRPGDASSRLFEVVFDYGEHDRSLPTPVEIQPWPVRSDPFSSYRAGFEIRTYRLCRRVLMFHHIDALSAAPYLVRSTDFEYEERAHLTRLRRATGVGYVRRDNGFERAVLPPLDLSYTDRVFHDEVRTLPRESLNGIPAGVDGKGTQWVDLDGEGVSGVLIADDRGWRYKSNLGDGRLAAPRLLPSLPTISDIGSGLQQLSDIDGDGRLELVSYGKVPGYFSRTEDGGWEPFALFRSFPNIDWQDPNLRFLDVDGDGLTDVLITEDEAFISYRSAGQKGFELASQVSRPQHEARGAAVVFSNPVEIIHLADMTGDGLVDIVRVRRGEVCYWPNLGYGRFGRKVTMAMPPITRVPDDEFSSPDDFDPAQIRWSDVDGSGTADLVYLGKRGVRVYFNESGNALAAPHTLALPIPDNASTVQVLDILGDGTSSIVWSSPLPGVRPIAFVDLMGGIKPHMLSTVVNNLGIEMRLTFRSSTRFYLQDKAAGQPWFTRLPHPVQVLDRVEHVDRIAKTRLVTTYRYHHGFYDGVEREFRGFAFVEQLDAEKISAERGAGLFTDGFEIVDGDMRVPPVLTRTWFHTGVWLGREELEAQLATQFFKGDPDAPKLPPSILPPGLSTAEEREATRALRGRILRQEVYAQDNTLESEVPYSVLAHNYEVRLLQHARGTDRASFFVHPSEQLQLHYERQPRDPRLQHTLVLAVDDFGNVTQSAVLAYPRRMPRQPEQERLWATVNDNRVANVADSPRTYRVGVAVASSTSEILGLTPPPSQRALALAEVRDAIACARRVPFEAEVREGLALRLIAGMRMLYYRDDLSGPLPFGEVGIRALVYQKQSLALTPGLVSQVYGQRVSDSDLTQAGYLRQDDGWWLPSSRPVYDPAAFYLLVAAIDPFGNRTTIRYDQYALLVGETEDALHNRVTAGERDATGVSSFDGLDYRVLAAKLYTDANLNRTAIAFEPLGMVSAIALMGKAGSGQGDTIEDPTIRIEYGFLNFVSSSGTTPAFVHTQAREQHGSANRRFQDTYSYVDGSLREAMRKLPAAPGMVLARDASGHLLHDPDGSLRMRFAPRRWVGTGRTIFDNKGNAIKKYEPFFSETFGFENERALVEAGVTPILRYDPVGRLIRTDLPDGTVRRIEIGPWLRLSWDENDTVLESQWYVVRGQPDPHGPEPRGKPAQRAAWLAAQHANTPPRTHLDSLAHTFLAEADNHDPRGRYQTRSKLDVRGNELAITDARGNRTVSSKTYDLLRRGLSTSTADAGDARALPDVMDQPVRTWDSRGSVFRLRYDELHRKTHVFVSLAGAPELLVQRMVYGEGHPDATARNLRSRIYQTYDGAGVLTNNAFDFKGNLLQSSRRLALAYRGTVDWAAIADISDIATIAAVARELLEDEVFETSNRYDALNRIVARTAPDGSTTEPRYNEASQVDQIQVVSGAGGSATALVGSIEYNARSQRTRVVFGNGTTSVYDYDPETFRLVHASTRQPSGGKLQDLRYELDPIGNIVQITDALSYGNSAVRGDGFYAYDALYRLIRAEGREHPGQQPSAADAEQLRLDHPHDLQALRRYRETYDYDVVGNILRMAHVPCDSHAAGWVRRYLYAADSNRLLRTSGPDEAPDMLSERYAYDAHGNITALPSLAELRWDHANRLMLADRAGGGRVFFTYDPQGTRVRKVYEHGGLVEERIYLGGYEVFRRRASSGETTFERQTLHVMDEGHRVALIESNTLDATVPAFSPVTRLRYQLEDHLGSSILELDERANVISLEEYLPFGATALRAASGALLGPKRYRYTGRERDEETGLYYNQDRYYAAWLGRWSAPDPAAIGAGPNVYDYVHNNPIVLRDPSGRQGQTCQPTCGVYDEAALVCRSEECTPETPATPVSEAPDESASETPIRSEAAVSTQTPAETEETVPVGYGLPTTTGGPAIQFGLAALREATTPVGPTGVPLEGPLVLYSGTQARTLAPAIPGYLIRDTSLYGPAAAQEANLRALLGIPEPGLLPPEQYFPIWGQASRTAVIDATLSGHGVTSANIQNGLPIDPASIQATTELPWARGLGSGLGVLSAAGGILTIYSATDPTLPAPLVPVAVTSGSLQFAGGTAVVVGSIGTDGAMVAAGTAVAETGGLLAIPLLMWANIKLSIENQKAIQPTVDKMINDGNYLGAALLSTPITAGGYGF